MQSPLLSPLSSLSTIFSLMLLMLLSLMHMHTHTRVFSAMSAVSRSSAKTVVSAQTVLSEDGHQMVTGLMRVFECHDDE